MTLVPVIMSGGAGSRLWPVSRMAHPKPFLRMADGMSLIQHTWLRSLALPGVAEIVTVTNRELFFITEDEYSETGRKPARSTYLLEPEGRDTAAAIAAATLQVMEEHGPDAIVCVFASDHAVADVDGFVAAVGEAAKLAAKGRIVTFGIRPAHPETGYGYIEAKGADVLRFVEKPDLATAKKYLEAGNFYWNSGMFCFAAGTMATAMEKHCPQVIAACRAALAAANRRKSRGADVIDLDETEFAKAPKISVDYAVMEKSSGIAVVPCEIGWSDIGSWNAIAEATEADANGNRATGETILLDSHDNYVRTEGRLVATVGVKDLVIVDTPDALLVASKDRAQDVKNVFNELKSGGHEAHLLHRTAHRPWGTYTVLEEGERFKIKRIEVKPGAKLSLQMHHHRSEHWVVVSGTAKVRNGDEEMILTTNQSTYIPCGALHRLENPGVMRLVMIEVQSGDYLGEDDIVRFDDTYGRS
jgi:mannose-1-phosphate guanylyltransferase/mannose-6-phosphate isomerase